MCKNNVLTEEECLKLLDDYGTPSHVIRHCKSVSRVAVIIAKELNKRGFSLDIEVIRTASLLHDIARVEDHHCEVGAKLLYNMHLDDVADIVKVHMHHVFPDDVSQIKEVDVVCLGDRLVQEDIFVGIDARMEYVLNKIKNDDRLKEIVSKKVEHSKIFIKKLECFIGNTIENMIKENDK